MRLTRDEVRAFRSSWRMRATTTLAICFAVTVATVGGHGFWKKPFAFPMLLPHVLLLA